MSSIKRKLIEVAMPLEAINRESAREKAIRHGHPATLHLWWARRPLSACRTVLFSQLVDDPSSHPNRFPTLRDQEIERNRLLAMVERLSRWESMGDHTFLNEVHNEIKNSFIGEIPTVFDPFAGGGSIPLEAQRLGLRAHASDLNPVAVLLNKSLIEIPPKWNSFNPVAPGRKEEKLSWPSITGLACDVKYYGDVVLQGVMKKIGISYPVVLNPEGIEVEVVAWIWARTVTCPNPACGVEMPLARSFWLRKDDKHSVWIKPILKDRKFKYEIFSNGEGPEIEGTVNRNGGICLACRANVTLNYIRDQGKTLGLGVDLMAVIATGIREKIYLPADDVQIAASQVPRPENIPTESLPVNPRDFKTSNYGLSTFASLFTPRQLLALTSFSDEIVSIENQIEGDALAAGLSNRHAKAYATDVLTYLTLALGRCADYNSSICTWHINAQTISHTFVRQSIPMTWDFAETNVLGSASGNWTGQVNWIFKVLENLNTGIAGVVQQLSATDLEMPINSVVSTDPPYYDNVGYADLSDYFYIWLRRTLKSSYPKIMSTLMTPKNEELVATPYRFAGSKEKAKDFFEDGFIRTFKNIKRNHDPDVPMTVYYAFKQSEEETEGTASTGWETMLNAILIAGFSIDATWPIRTELATRMIGSGKNALASSIVLACRVKSGVEDATTRRNFIAALKVELPIALRTLQQASIAPVDLAQAAIGPGMSIYSRFAKVIEADGSDMTVRTALQLINQALDEVISEQEGDFDPETRFCLKWFSQYGWNPGTSGEADVLSRAVNTSLNVLERGGVFKAVAGKATLIEGKNMSKEWDPLQDKTISAWEVAVRVATALQTEGLEKAVFWSNQASKRVDLDSVKELSYLLFSISEKKGWIDSAILFNGLGTSWSDMNGLMSKRIEVAPKQDQLEFGENNS
jgi:putative DNA methylase